jgi:hypothetical protein
MEIKPSVTLTKEQVEEILAKESPERREQIRKMLEHSCSFYDFSGKHLSHPYEKDNLLELISQRETYIVDNNSPWKSECKKHLKKAFIITSALSREHPNTIALILDATRSNLGNIFAFGCYASKGIVHIDKIDTSFRHVFDMQKLEQASAKEGDGFAKQVAQERINNEHDRAAIRNHVSIELLFLSVLGKIPLKTDFMQTGKASDLPNPNSLQEMISRIQADIQRRLPKCKHNLKNTKNTVERCYVKLLLEDRKTRYDFDRLNYDNVFGDMYIVSAAIYFGAHILTEDKGLKRMASYAGINCFKQVE